MMFNRWNKLMRRIILLAFGLAGLFIMGVHPVAGQINGSIVQGGSHPAVGHGAQASVAHSAARASSQNFGRGPIAVGPRVIDSHPVGMLAYSGMTSRPNYSPYMRSLNPTLAAINARRVARIYHVQSTANLMERNELARKRLAFANRRNGQDAADYSGRTTAATLASRQVPRGSLITNSKDFEVDRPTTTPQLTSGDLAPHKTLHATTTPDGKGRDNRLNFSDARRCHWHEWHNRDWWCQHFNTIVLVGGGYYFWDAGYWYPAWGYDPLNNYYDYDGPISTYGNLLPDEVITNVQAALQEAGYYFGPVTGSLDDETRAALANFQRDYGLPITGAIDQPTIESLGLY